MKTEFKTDRVVLNLSKEQADKLLGHLEISLKVMGQQVESTYASACEQIIKRLKKTIGRRNGSTN